VQPGAESRASKPEYYQPNSKPKALMVMYILNMRINKPLGLFSFLLSILINEIITGKL
jgi:hypothetical protein